MSTDLQPGQDWFAARTEQLLSGAYAAAVVTSDSSDATRTLQFWHPGAHTGVRTGKRIRAWVEGVQFAATPGSVLPLPPKADTWLVGDIRKSPAAMGRIPARLPAGSYHIANPPKEFARYVDLAVHWGLSQYRFKSHRADILAEPPRTLIVPEAIAQAAASILTAWAMCRDLINAPANVLSPHRLACIVQRIGEHFADDVAVTAGQEALLELGFPLTVAVAQGSVRPPQVIEWRTTPVAGQPKPEIVLIGKGVTFDSGGLNLKPDRGMLLMRKDMGGAAHVIALAMLLRTVAPHIPIRTIIPTTDNMAGGDAMKPGDTFQARNGKTVEIGHTDAEGRLLLADALLFAQRTLESEAGAAGVTNPAKPPPCIIDMATLTGAARVALGTSLPAVFANTAAEKMARNVLKKGVACGDPMWQLPLHPPYKSKVSGKFADLTNSPSSGFGGAITAGLFLEEFVDTIYPWIHVDVMAWRENSSNGQPEGGEMQGVMALFYAILDKFQRIEPTPKT